MKKRFFALVLIAVLALTTGLTATTAFASYKVKSFEADVTAIEIGSEKAVGFTAELERGMASYIEVFDDQGRCVSYLYDNGMNGDARANDGIYYGTAKLSETSVGTVEYTIARGDSFASCEIKFYRPLTDKDWFCHDAVWANIDEIEASLEQMKATDEEIFQSVYEYLSKDENVAKVWFETDTIINFDLTSGIGNIYTRFTDEQMKSAGASTDELMAAAEELSNDMRNSDYGYIQDPDIGVWSPYYGYDSNFSYNYIDRAEQCAPTSGGEAHGFYGDDASYESFKTWNEYGVVMIDSHGTIYSGKSVICVPAPGPYDNIDMEEGHIFSLGGGEIGITGSFFLKYCPDMPNTLIYSGICLGFATNALADPLLEAGAGFYMGYTESVTFYYDGLMMDSIFEFLCTENPETGKLYTSSEACIAAQGVHGDIDPYGDAVLIWAGDESLIMQDNPIPVESVQIDPGEWDMYINNTVALMPLVEPIDANRYSVSWSSSDESIVSVDENGVATAHKEGVANVICTIEDNAPDEANTITAECTINVLGIMDASGIIFEADPITLFMGNENFIVSAGAYPENASNQNILWASSDESILKIDEDGTLHPVSPGTAVIIAETEDGGFQQGRICNVIDTAIDVAVNHGNYTLGFENDEVNPWVVDVETDPDRVSARSDIAGMTNTSAAFSMETVTLSAGDTLTFDWRVSSEKNYDTLQFLVNGEEEDRISGELEWANYTYSIPADGNYTFTWIYSKDRSHSDGSDCAWVDEIMVNIEGSEAEEIEITFVDNDESVIYSYVTTTVDEIVYPCNPYKEGMTFIGWDKSGIFDCDTTVTAVYVEGELARGDNMHMVSFTGLYDEIFSAVYVKDGEALEYPLMDYLNSMYKTESGEPIPFYGWVNDVETVTEDTVINGIFGIIGDANANLSIDSGDAAMVLRIAVEIIESTHTIDILGDFNGDGILNTGDAAGILSHAVGLA